MRTLDELCPGGRRVLLRADLNVPLTPPQEGRARQVADDTRIRAALPTIEVLRAQGAAIVLVSHLGRPHGHDSSLSMRPVAERLQALLGAPVALAPAVVGPAVRALAQDLRPGEILMLENVRFEAGETENDPALARSLAELADLYVDDAFATAHRAHASNEAVARLLPAAAGLLVAHEVAALGDLVEHPARPLVAVLGGGKVSDKLELVERFLTIADRVLVGGALAFPFLAAEGHATGESEYTREDLATARRARRLDAASGRLRLPGDLVVAPSCSADAPTHIVTTPDAPAGQLGLDIGPLTIACFTKLIAGAGTVFWNGPMGVFECEPFALGTRCVAHAVAGCSAHTIVGGGETVQAVNELGLGREIDHVSTGGGATMQFLLGRPLPGLAVLAAPSQQAVA